MPTSDHFAVYMTLIGTFGALAITRLFDSRREARKEAREDRNRLHDMRVSAYVDYLSAASEIFGPSDVRFEKALIDGPLASSEEDAVVAYPKYLAAHSRVILVASAAVFNTVVEVDKAVRQLVRSSETKERANALDALQAARKWFFSAARVDLGIPETEVRNLTSKLGLQGRAATDRIPAEQSRT